MRRRAIAVCLLFGCLKSIEGEDKECPAQLHLNGDLWKYRSRYNNPAYGYSTQIPDGLTGVDPKNPFYQKGFSILPLAGGYLTVYAEVNSALYRSADAAAKDNLSDLKSEVDSISSVKYQPIQLGSRPAAQSTVIFHCQGLKETYTDISIFALNSTGRFVYTITWQGPQTGKVPAEKAIRSIEGSWRFLTLQ